MSKILDKLEGKKWIVRRILAEDNRVQVLSLTSQGRGILPQLAEIADPDAGEKALLRHLLQKLTDFHQIRDVPTE